jgi:transcriptional regulator GlxA family with amidase domain
MVTLNVNGKSRDLDIPADMPLLWTPRDVLNMTGTKFDSGMGLCGACTINIDEHPTRSSITLRVELMAVVREALITAAAASNDIDADVQRDVKASYARPPVSSVPRRLLGGLAPGALRRVREYIEQHLDESIATDALARIARLSSGHFNRAFKQSTGESPHHYIIRKRIAMAKELLVQTNRALADIALDAGFADQSHFSRTYVAITGETPSACRRRHR